MLTKKIDDASFPSDGVTFPATEGFKMCAVSAENLDVAWNKIKTKS